MPGRVPRGGCGEAADSEFVVCIVYHDICGYWLVLVVIDWTQSQRSWNFHGDTDGCVRPRPCGVCTG